MSIRKLLSLTIILAFAGSVQAASNTPLTPTGPTTTNTPNIPVNLPANPCPDGWSLVPGSNTGSGAFTCTPKKVAKIQCPPKHEWFDEGCSVGCRKLIY